MKISTRQVGEVYQSWMSPGDITLYNSPELRKVLLDLIKTKKCRA